MIRLLPFILIPIVIVGGLFYWRYSASLPSLIAPDTEESEPVEVPKILPGFDESPLPSATSKSTTAPKPQSSSALDSRVTTVESTITELKARISALEKATPAPAAASGSQSTVYIPLGSGGGPWANVDWYAAPEYEISLDPSNYPGYTGMTLEVTMRLVESAGTGSVRLYNATDGSGVSSELTTTSTTYALSTSPSFNLSSGTKTYRLQLKSTAGKDLFIQSARIKVKF